MSPKDIGGAQIGSGWRVGHLDNVHHVLVHLVRLINWEFTSPEDPPITQLTPWPGAEAYFTKYFPSWQPPWPADGEGGEVEGRLGEGDCDITEEDIDSGCVEEEEEDCWHCGWPWSARHRCPAWGVRCHRCGLPNHYARMCRTGAAEEDILTTTTTTELATSAINDTTSDPDHTSLSATTTTTTTAPASPDDVITGSGGLTNRKKPHRKRKKTAKQKKRDQERLQKFLEKKALEQHLLEQGLEVDEIAEILSSVAASTMVEKLTEAGEWDAETLKTRMDQLPEHQPVVAMDTTATSTSKEADDEADRMSPQRPMSLESTPKKRIVPNMELLHDVHDDSTLAHASVSSSEGEPLDSFNDLHTPDDLNTPEALGDSIFEGELDWEDSDEGSEGTPVDPIPEYSAREEFEDEKNWRSVTVGDRQFRIDMKVIEPYKKVLSHGGYYGDGFNAILIFAGCYLPDKRRRDYHYVMDNLFLYVLSTLELLVVEDYMVVYFHGATPKQRMPSLRWLKRCYEMIDRRLRKNLKSLLIVHPTLWIKTIMTLTKPFISSKFSSKLKYIRGLKELAEAVPMEYIFVPDEIKIYQEEMEELEKMSKEERKAKEKRDKKLMKEEKKQQKKKKKQKK